MPESFAYDVFLSHNQPDKPRVRRLAERLRAAGLRVWLVPPKPLGVGGFDEWIIQPGNDLARVEQLGTRQPTVRCAI